MTDGQEIPNGKEAIVYFESTVEAILAEQALAGRGVFVRVMPTPSGIRAGCGFCLRFLPEDIERAAIVLLECGITVAEVYVRKDADDGESYMKISLRNTETRDE
jgi:hypothetical protein